MLASDLLGDGASAGASSSSDGPEPLSSSGRERSVRRQVEVLVWKQLAMKARNWRWTLAEWIFPLQGVAFLYLIFTLGSKSFMPFEKIETQAQNFEPANLLNASAPGLLALMHVGGSVAFAPASRLQESGGDGSVTEDQTAAAKDAAAARAVYSVFCGSYQAMLASPEYQQVVQEIEATVQQSGGDASACDVDPSSMECSAQGIIGQLGDTTPGECLWLPDAESMVSKGGWLPFLDAANPQGSSQAPAGLYLGVEVGAHRMNIRYEEMLLAENANADPREKNAARSGLLAMQTTVSSLLLLHDVCPMEMEGCDKDCVAAMGGLISDPDLRKCLENPRTLTCGALMASRLPSAGVQLLLCMYSQYATGDAVQMERMDPFSLFIERFPIRARSELVNVRKYLYPANFVPILGLTCQGTLTLLGEEKEKGIKDALSLKGMSRLAYYLAWFISQSLGMTVSCVMVAVASRMAGVIEHTSMLHFGGMAWVFGCWFITLAFLICSLLKTTKSMFVVGIIMLIIIIYTAYLPEILMIGPGSSGVPSPYWKVLLLFLFPPVPYGHLLWVLSDGELQGTGWTTGLTAKSWPTATHDYYYEAHLFMFLDVFLYLGLAWLLDLLLSDPLALRRPQGKSGDSGGDLELTSTTSDAAGISIRGLSKRFSWKEKDGWKRVTKSVQAVDKLDLEVSKQSLFCLLGHNGAGAQQSFESLKLINLMKSDHSPRQAQDKRKED
jgi:hypothetical protein